MTVIGSPPEEPPPEPCPDCGYEGCVCDQPSVRSTDDFVLLDDVDDWPVPGEGGRP